MIIATSRNILFHLRFYINTRNIVHPRPRSGVNDPSLQRISFGQRAYLIDSLFPKDIEVSGVYNIKKRPSVCSFSPVL